MLNAVAVFPAMERTSERLPTSVHGLGTVTTLDGLQDILRSPRHTARVGHREINLIHRIGAGEIAARRCTESAPSHRQSPTARRSQPAREKRR